MTWFLIDISISVTCEKSHDILSCVMNQSFDSSWHYSKVVFGIETGIHGV